MGTPKHDVRVRVQLRLAPSQYRAMRMVAAVDDLDLAYVLARCVREYLERRPEIVQAVEATAP